MGRDCSISMRIAPLRQVSGISDFNGVHLLWLCKSWCWVCKSFLLENLILTCEVIHSGPLSKQIASPVNIYLVLHPNSSVDKGLRDFPLFFLSSLVTALRHVVVQRKACLKQVRVGLCGFSSDKH